MENILQEEYSLNFDLNDGCNLYCSMCPFHGKDYGANVATQKVISREVFLEKALPIISRAARIQFGCIHEPSILPDFQFFVESIAKARPRPLQPISFWGAIQSNAIPLTEKKLEILLSSGMINEVKFSCDGTDAETFEKIRLGAKFDIFLKRAKFVRQFIDANKLDIRQHFVFTLQPTNAHQFSFFHAWALEHGADYIIIHGLDGGQTYAPELQRFYNEYCSKRQYFELPYPLEPSKTYRMDLDCNLYPAS
jgi:molybdenum cofactor biosynthesis enzyme MoaA